MYLPLVFAIAFVLLSLITYLIWHGSKTKIKGLDYSSLNSEVRSRQAQSEILIQSITDGVVVFNPEGKITLINPAACAMAEWRVDEATGIDVRQVIRLAAEDGKPLDRGEDLFAEALAAKEHITKTLTLIGHSTTKRTIISLVLSPIIIPKTELVAGVVAVFRDVSQTKREEQRRAEFVSTASHEMRTPVAAIEGYLALALNPKVSQIDEHARSYLEKAHESTRHLGQLFQDLLTSAKVEDGRLSSHPTAVEMGEFTKRVAEDLKFSADKKGLAVELIIGRAEQDNGQPDGSTTKVIHPLYYVFADPDRLREVVTNLFDNAVKYTDTGKITLGLTGDNDIVQLRVSDTGNGIGAEDIPHLFQKFYRVDNSATRTVGGTGLGLFICRKIVELYNGRIWVESQEGQGSTFYINLPRLTSQKATEIQASTPTKAASVPGVTNS